MDQQIKNKFENYQPEPPEQLWETIYQQIGKPATVSLIKILRNKYLYVAVAVVCILTVTSIILINRNQDEKPTISDNQSPVLSKDTNIPDATPELINIPSATETPALEDQKNVPAKPLKEISPGKNPTGSSSPSALSPGELITKSLPAIPISGAVGNKKVTEHSGTQQESTNNTALRQHILPLEPLIVNIISPHPVPASIPSSLKSGGKVQYGRPEKRFALALYYAPEKLYFTRDDIARDWIHHIDINVYYMRSEFFIQSGAGVFFSKDIGTCQIDYSKYDLVGSYEDVYEITFDSTAYGIVPVYHTQTIDVYDSVDHTMVTDMDKKYTYFQIPVLAGFRGTLHKRFSWQVKSGFLFSLMMHDKEETISFPDGEIRIKNVSNSLPDRLHTSWQFMIGGGFDYKLTNRLTFSVEPSVVYYLNTGYQNALLSTKHPYGINLKTGMMILF